MAGGKRKNDDIIIAALAAGATRKEAASKAQVAESTVYRKLKDPDFVAAVDEKRAELIEQTLGRLAGLADTAIITLGLLLKSKSDQVRLGAARAIVQSLLSVREQVSLAQQIAELRELVEETEAGRWAA